MANRPRSGSGARGLAGSGSGRRGGVRVGRVPLGSAGSGSGWVGRVGFWGRGRVGSRLLRAGKDRVDRGQVLRGGRPGGAGWGVRPDLFGRGRPRHHTRGHRLLGEQPAECDGQHEWDPALVRERLEGGQPLPRGRRRAVPASLPSGGLPAACAYGGAAWPTAGRWPAGRTAACPARNSRAAGSSSASRLRFNSEPSFARRGRAG